MGTRRHKKHPRRRYRGGEEFVPKPFVAPTPNPNSRRAPNLAVLKAAHEESEKKRYEDWKAKREVEAREDMKGHEENRAMAPFYEKKRNELSRELIDTTRDRDSDAKMAPFFEKKKNELRQELIDTARHREEADIESTRKADEKKRRAECREHLKSHDPPLRSPNSVQTWLADKSNQKNNPSDYKEVRDCLRILKAPKGGRRTRRRKSHRRR
jgi:hypothetical protein